MCRRFLAVLICLLLILLFAPMVMAEPKPTNVPVQVLPGDAEFAATFGSNTFADLWVDLDGEPTAYQLPGTTNALSGLLPPTSQPDPDDFLRGQVIGDAVTGALKDIVGFPIGFPFEYMHGPFGSGGAYERVYVAINGFIIFDDPWAQEYGCYPDEPIQQCDPADPTTWHWVWMGQWNWWPWQLPIREPPNNFIAPYWTDLAIGDNSYWAVTEIDCPEWPDQGECEVPDDGWDLVQREHGKLLVATLGEEPNRRFVVEWLNARNPWTGFLCTFELQLFETSNAILFLYKDFQTKGSGPYFEIPSVLIGGEDYYGTTPMLGAVYQLPGWYAPWDISGREYYGLQPKPIALDFGFGAFGIGIGVPGPMQAGDMLGFVP